MLIRWGKDTNGFVYGFCQCLVCKQILNMDKKSCKAFKEIPDNIWSNDIWHNAPLKDQKNDIVFVPIEK